MFYKPHILSCYYHSFQGVGAEKQNLAIALDGILILKLTRANPKAITQKIQASLSHAAAPVTQCAPHRAKQGSSKR